MLLRRFGEDEQVVASRSGRVDHVVEDVDLDHIAQALAVAHRLLDSLVDQLDSDLTEVGRVGGRQQHTRHAGRPVEPDCGRPSDQARWHPDMGGSVTLQQW